VQRHGIIKALQAAAALEYLASEDAAARDALRRRVCDLNARKVCHDAPRRLCAEYLAGLFDAEGNCFVGRRGRLYVKITQPSAPELLQHVQAALGCGSTGERGRWKVYRKADALRVARGLLRHSRLKRSQLLAVVAACGPGRPADARPAVACPPPARPAVACPPPPARPAVACAPAVAWPVCAPVCVR
jgi:hypothetical protein